MCGGVLMEFSKNDTKTIKGVAICFMLWHHLFGAPMRIPADSFVSLFSVNGNQSATLVAIFAKICVAMFTFMSGYGLYKSSAIKGCSSSFIAKHLLSLYKYVWIIFIINLPFSIYKYRDFGSEIIYETIYNFIGLKATINREWWFIAPYVMLLVLFPFIKRFIDRKNAYFFFDVFVVVLLSAFNNYLLQPIMELSVMQKLNASFLWGNFTCFFNILPAFLLGSIVAKYDILTYIKNCFSGKRFFCFISIIAILAVFLVSFRNLSKYDYIDAAVLIVAITILIPTKPFQVFNKLLIPLGENSTAMWLVHSFFCYYWYPPAVYFPKYPILIFIWLVFLSYITALFLKVVLQRIEARMKKKLVYYA